MTFVTGMRSIVGKFMVPYLGSIPRSPAQQLHAQTTRLKDLDQLDWSVLVASYKPQPATPSITNRWDNCQG